MISIFGIISILCMFGAVRSLQTGTTDLKKARQEGRGILSLFRGRLADNPNSDPCSRGINSHRNATGGITYYKKSRLLCH